MAFPSWDNVALLLHCDGPNGGTAFVDSSSHGHSVEAAGSASLSTAKAIYGSAALYMPGSAGGLAIPSSSAFDFAAGDFTVEFFLRPESSAWADLVGKYGAIFPRSFAIQKRDAKLHTLINLGSSSGWSVDGGASTDVLPNNVVTHCAFVRKAGVFRLFAAGAKCWEDASHVGEALSFASEPLMIGAAPYGGNYLNGSIDDIRIVTGEALYWAEFTPPTAAFPGNIDPYWDSVTLMLHGDGANDSTAVVDSSASAHVVTCLADSKIKTANPKFGTGSIYFDGVDDQLTIPAASDFDFGTGDFTVESFCYLSRDADQNSGNGQREAAIFSVGSAGAPDRFLIQILGDGSTSGTGLLLWNGSGGVGVTGAIGKNGWHHIAVCRASDVVRFFVDGSQMGGDQASTLSYGSATEPVRVGARHGTSFPSFFPGYMDEVRVTKGVGRYTANFTAPTRAFPAGSIEAVVGEIAATFGIDAVLLGVVSPPTTVGVIDGVLNLGVDFSGAQAVTGVAAAVLDLIATASGQHAVAGAMSATLGISAVIAGVHPLYRLHGSVRDGGDLVDRRVRVYRRSTGALVAQADTVAGVFDFDVGYAPDEYYLVPIDLANDATDWRPPCANRVLSVLVSD